MCGRYSFAIEDALIRERFGVSVRTAIYKARYNCAPGQTLAVITNRDPEELQGFRWGLIPFWAKDPSIGNRLINARAETLTGKPSFRSAFNRQRCLVPADGFYEWRPGTVKTPYRITLREGEPFAMAGIWDQWVNPGGETLYSFSVITTEPNALMVPIHNRMPAILLPEDEKRWLDDGQAKVLESLLKPYPASRMRAFPVSSLVNSPKHDSPELLIPAGEDLT